MQPINMIMHYFWDKKPEKRLYVQEHNNEKKKQTKQSTLIWCFKNASFEDAKKKKQKNKTKTNNIDLLFQKCILWGCIFETLYYFKKIVNQLAHYIKDISYI